LGSFDGSPNAASYHALKFGEAPFDDARKAKFWVETWKAAHKKARAVGWLNS